MNAGVQAWVYPEELEHTEPEALAEQVLSLGCDAVAVAVVYHRARRVFPRHRRISVLRECTVYVEPQRARYGTLVPGGTATPALLRFREACERAGLRFRAWIVPLHHDGLVAAHPEAAALLLDGTPAGHALCPSQPAVVEYAAALAADVAAQLAPEAIDFEAAFHPAWEPSYTLTLALDPLTDEERLLAAQCFCDACRPFFSAGVPGRTRAGGDPGLRDELARGRAASAARLVEAVAAAVHAEGALLRVSCSGPPEQAALQGVSPEATAAADAILYGCGPLDGAELLARFAGLRALTGRTGTVSTNWTPARADLAGDAARLAENGAEGLALYNLSLVPDAGLAAFRAAAEAFHAAVPAR